ncbi:MAG: transcriptional regulator GcvA [Rhodospirillaceae bacterium]|jgi:LysR family transcriptional regulator, glycine cleavage system transcriptional activator|nr:transcriptional regulator GcvA [Rhodospirillaceae bacterium]MBT4688984.1 transcriptional regulator GcvA [Rhodospirillaceae bacterium]MBT5083663.1 transcriptional regulator GcvA [Rhodospirillaceae bacterium]MBT5522539.1 transcriptional regulator GcvA [Rhodospirillaceae bacterium]MBT5877997.1 transcriptional regulator GcvA [Rhodospirillaceae bacterium]
MTDIPSTTALLAFRTAAHHLSFLQAAQIRNVTPGAISRQIQGLEEMLGTRLFHRHHKRVELTAQGRDYLAEISTPLDHLAAATARLRGERHSAAISICAYPTFAIRWLLPRWGRFYDRHPDVDVRLTTSLNPVDFSRDDYDLSIQVMGGNAQTAGLQSHQFLSVDTYPICSPDVAARINAPSDLVEHTLIHSGPRPTDWRRWLTTVGLPTLNGARELRFESLNLAIQAAIEGIGVAIGIDALVREDLAQGRLVRLFDMQRRSNHPFHIVYPDGKAKDERLIAFRDWLLEEAATASPRTVCG